jgi:hypothetical protein
MDAFRPKNIKTVFEEKAVCRLHRMTIEKKVLGRERPTTARGKEVTAAL